MKQRIAQCLCHRASTEPAKNEPAHHQGTKSALQRERERGRTGISPPGNPPGHPVRGLATLLLPCSTGMVTQPQSQNQKEPLHNPEAELRDAPGHRSSLQTATPRAFLSPPDTKTLSQECLFLLRAHPVPQHLLQRSPKSFSSISASKASPGFVPLSPPRTLHSLSHLPNLQISTLPYPIPPPIFRPLFPFPSPHPCRAPHTLPMPFDPTKNPT